MTLPPSSPDSGGFPQCVQASGPAVRQECSYVWSLPLQLGRPQLGPSGKQSQRGPLLNDLFNLLN